MTPLSSFVQSLAAGVERQRLERALPFLELREGAPLPAFRDGVLDLLGDSFAPNPSQRALDTPATARIYDAARRSLAPLLGMPAFEAEVEALVERLDLREGDVVLDLACGHGNFSIELARRVGPDGLVIGVDIAWSMLRRAVVHRAREGIENLVLVRGDAEQLPLGDATLSKLNCSGGFHQLPDLARALDELARVARPGARVTLSMFARPREEQTTWLQRVMQRFQGEFVPLDALGRGLTKRSFENYRSEMRGPFTGYAWARMRSA